MTTLIVSHHIYLTRDERYSLHNGKSIEVVGVSIPVWFSRGNTSEPAQEVFCKYKLTNDIIDKILNPIQDGYSINLPQKIELLDGEKETLDNLEIELPNSKNLLDLKDGGIEKIEFSQNDKIQQNGREFKVIHFVEIKPIEVLLETIV